MADISLLLLTLLWGTSFLLVKNALDGTGSALFLALRFGVAAVALGAVQLARRDRATPGLARHGLALGLLMWAGFVLQTVGLRYTTPAHSGFITGLSALFVPFIARFALGRRVPASSWAGVLLAMAGLAMLTRPFGQNVTAAMRLGDLLTLGCVLAFALQIVFTSEWSPSHALVPLVLTQVGVTLAGALLLLPFEGVALRPSPALYGTVAFLGLPLTAGAFFVMAWAQRHTTAVRAALIFSLEPVAAALFSHLVGGEPLGRLDWGGGALMVLGVLVGELGGALRRGARRGAVSAP